MRLEDMHVLKIENNSEIVKNVVCSHSLQKASYSEIYEIIKHFDDELKKKIPPKFISFIKNNRDIDYKVHIDYSKNLSEQNLMHETKVMLSVIYRNFLCSKDEKEKLQNKEKEELLEIEKKKIEKYNPDNIFTTKKRIETLDDTSVSMIEYKNSLLSKIMHKIKSFFGMN